MVTFYHFFREHSAGQHIVQPVPRRGLPGHGGRRARGACQAAGSGVDFHETTADGEFSLEPVYLPRQLRLFPGCNDRRRLYGRVTPERFDAMLATETETQ